MWKINEDSLPLNVSQNQWAYLHNWLSSYLSSFWPQANIISMTDNPQVYKYPSDFLQILYKD